jgi:hypothetical protein
MPAGAIHIEPDSVPMQPAIELREGAKEPLSIAPRRLEHPIPTQQGGHPPRDIQPLAMLTGGRNPQAPPPSSPPPTHPRVQGEPRLVLEDHGLSRAQGRWCIHRCACRTCTAIPKCRFRCTTTVGPSHWARCSPTACGDCSRCRASACWIWGAKRVGRPGLGLGAKASSPAVFTPWIQRLRLMRVMPKTSAIHPGRCPSRRRKGRDLYPNPRPGHFLG